ncbi:hypothetical protein POM88_038640 [Heracleum sosnowskyi]|uniref:Uncharacterized protein n=1 Tax=Heracleum sosnowskyi TaxID=360622 RepID=A0AAD8M7Z9_9APIA|nr:hypothetical protein POM88_038640 [Heracleum sosnowskyi]
MCYSNGWNPSLYCEERAKILRIVLCSHEFRLSIYNAIKFIPEGQVSGFIQLLTADVSESLVWMEGDCSTNARTNPGELDSDNCSLPCFMLKAEVLGRSLSELYSLILDSTTTTVGNSTLVGVAVKDLIGEIRPNMQCLVGVQSDSVYSCLSTLTGITITMEDECKHVCMPTPWIVVFFFRLYMSSKSLYRQAVSLVPPEMSRKMLKSMGDSWLVRTGKKDKGYFSWIVQPSASLPSTIKAVLRICNLDSAADYSSLIYVLITMTFQRLVDLNRLIKSKKYSQYKKNKKQGQQASDMIISNNKEVSSLMHEAEELTSFLMEYITVLDENQLVANDVNDCELSVQSLPNNDGWDFSISSVDKKSLPTATWWIVCQNIDVWCAYPAQDKLKDFLSLLIQSSLPSSKNNFSVSGEHVPDKHGHMKTIRPHQISVELVSNAALYEQSFVCRHMASSLFKILENSVSPIFRNFTDIYLNELPDWSVLSNSSRSSSNVASSYIDAVHNYLLAAEPFSYSSDKLHLFKVKIEDCQSLLKFICWMPKGFLKTESLSDYTNCIINLERLLLGSLIKFSRALQHHESHELFRLFVLCRKTLNKLTMVYEERVEPMCDVSNCIHHESSFPASWFSMSLSAVVELQHMFPDDCASQSKALILSLMDHTSYMFLRFSRDKFMHVISTLTNLVKPCEEIPDFCPDTIVSIAECLVEQASKSLISLKETLSSKDVISCTVQDMEKISPTISCIQGFLWGLASALDEIDGKRWKLKSKSSKLKCDPFLRIRTHIDAFAECLSDFLNTMFLENGKVPQSSFETLDPPISKGHDDLLSLKVSSSKGRGYDADYNEKQQISQNEEGHLAFEMNDESSIRQSVLRKHDDVASLSIRIRFQQQYLKKSMLMGFLRGENLEAAYFLRQLFIAYSAILRINLRTIKNKFLSASWNPTFVGIAEVLLLEFADMVELPHELCFVWLDGISKFLEELGRQLHTAEATSTKAEATSTKAEATSTKAEATLTKDVYDMLSNMHLRALRKCIALQGKGAILASHETESSIKTVDEQTKLIDAYI